MKASGTITLRAFSEWTGAAETRKHSYLIGSHSDVVSGVVNMRIQMIR